MAVLLRIGLFAILLGNALTLITRVGPFHVYTVDFAIAPFLLLLTAWLVLRRGSLGIRWHWVDTAVALNMGLSLVSFALSDDMANSVMGTADWTRLTLLYAAFRALSVDVITPRVLVVQSALIVSLLIALGIAQMVTGKPIGLVANYFGRDLDQLSWSPVGTYGERWRISGPTPNSNVFAMWVIIFGGLVAAYYLQRARMVRLGVVLLGMATVILGTLSRGGGLGLVLFVGLLAWGFRKEILHAGVAVPLGVGLAFMLLLSVALLSGSLVPFLGEQFEIFAARGTQSLATAGADLRIRLLQVGFDMLGNAKVFLVGCGSDAMVQSLLSRFHSPEAVSVALRATGSGYELRTGMHNAWVRTAVEFGVPAAVAFFALFVGLLSTSRKMQRVAPDQTMMSLYLGAIGVWYLLIPSQVYLMAARLPVLLPLFLFLAYSVTRSTPPNPESQRGALASPPPSPFQPRHQRER